MKKMNSFLSMILATLLIFSCIPIHSYAEDIADNSIVSSDSFIPIQEYDSENSENDGTREVEYSDNSQLQEDKAQTNIILQQKVEANLNLTSGVPETATVNQEEEINLPEKFLEDDTVLGDLVPEASFDEKSDSFNQPIDENDIQTDFSLIFINASSSSVKVNIGNSAKITFGYTGYKGSVAFSASVDNQIINGSWGSWVDGQIDLTIVGRLSGTTNLTVNLIDTNHQILASKKIVITVTDNAGFSLSKTSDTINKGNSTTVGVKFSGTTSGMYCKASVSGNSVSISWGKQSGSTKYLNIYGKNAGTSRIKFYLYSQNGTLLQSKTADISVINNPSIGLSATSATVDIGGQKTFLIYANNVIGSYYFNYSLSNNNCTASWGAWSNNSFPLYVSGKNPGTTTITIKLYAKSGTLLASATISFTTRENPSVSCSNGNPSVQVGSSKIVTLSFKGINSSVYLTANKSNQNIRLTLGKISNNSCSLQIDGVSRGTSVITINLRKSDGSIAAYCNVTVSIVGTPTISFSASSLSMKVGDIKTLTASADNISGNYKMLFDVSGTTVTCSWLGNIVNSSASLSVKATKKGSSTITVYLKNESGIVVAQNSISVNVQPADVPKVNAQTRVVSVTKGKSEAVKITVGGVSDSVYVTAGADNDCVICSWGSTLLNTRTLNIKGNKLGDSVITVKLVKSSDNKVLATETIQVGVYVDTSLGSSLAFSFENYEDEIPYSTFVRAFGQNTRSARLYDKVHYAEGLCYGFSVASMLLKNGSYITPSAFGKSSTWSLKKNSNSSTYNMNVDSFLKWMFITQFSTISANTTQYDLNGLINYIKAGNIANVTITGSGGGHAVVGYQFDDAHNRLYICDSNWPGAIRYITVRKDSSGKYTGWYYNLFQDKTWGSSYGGKIGYQTLSAINSLWRNRESLSVYSGWISENVLITNSGNFSVYDIEDCLIATYVDGKLSCEENAAYLVEAIGYNPNAEYIDEDDDWVIIYFPAAFYSVKNNDTDIDSFHAEMISTELGVSVETEADEVYFGVDDSYNLCSTYITLDAGEEYAVELLSSREGEENITVNGVGLQDDVTLGLALENGVCTYLTDAQASIHIDGTFENGHLVTVQAGKGGKISPDGELSVLTGKSVTFTIAPDSCYEIEDVLVNGESVGALNEYTLLQVNKDTTVEAVFVQNENTHNYLLKSTVAPTCINEGYSLYECASCGSQKKANVTPQSGHSMKETVVAPSCTKSGYTLHSCINCSYSYTDAETEATAHKDENHDGICDYCKAVLNDGGQNLCPYCHQQHTGAFGTIIGFFHRILSFFQNLFG